MRLTEAREWRDKVRDLNVHATVPTGWGPNGYFVQIWTSRLGNIHEPTRMKTPEAVQSFIDAVSLANALRLREAASPIERLIDEALTAAAQQRLEQALRSG